VISYLKEKNLNMTKVALVTDSTASIPQEYVERYNIRVAPQILIWGDETYRDGVDIQPSEFFERLDTAKVMPTTSQASPQSFQEIYQELLEQDCSILTIVLSEELSGTLVSARQARDNFPGAPIEIIDSRTTAMAMGYIVLMAARAAEEGATLEQCKAIAEKARDNTGVIFTVNTLEFLHRGGRIGGGARLLGTALNLKPILEVTGGRVEAVERIRTRKKSLNRVIDLVEQRIAGRQPVHMATLHANAPEAAQQLLDEANQRFNAVESLLTEVSPVVGNHAGPGTVGLIFLAGM
jgi:DegV family protein with EDD domain